MPVALEVDAVGALTITSVTRRIPQQRLERPEAEISSAISCIRVSSSVRGEVDAFLREQLGTASRPPGSRRRGTDRPSSGTDRSRAPCGRAVCA